MKKFLTMSACLMAAAPMAMMVTACDPQAVNSVSTVAAVSADQAYVTYVQNLEAKVSSGTMTSADFHTKENQAYSALLLVRAGQMTSAAFTSTLNP